MGSLISLLVIYAFFPLAFFNRLFSVQDEDDSDEDQSDEETPKKVARSYWSSLFS